MTEIEKMIAEAKAKVSKTTSTTTSSEDQTKNDSPDEVTIVRQNHDHIRGQAKSGCDITGSKIRINGTVYEVMEQVRDYEEGCETTILQRKLEPLKPRLQDFGYRVVDDINLRSITTTSIKRILDDSLGETIKIASVDSETGDINIVEATFMGRQITDPNMTVIKINSDIKFTMGIETLIRLYYIANVLLDEEEPEESEEEEEIDFGEMIRQNLMI
jgi:hypothetical protein